MDKAALHEDENRSGAGYSAGTLGNIAAENLRTDGKAGAAFGSLDPPLWQPTASRAAEDDATMTSQAPVDAGLGQPNNPEDDGDISMADIDVEEQRRILRDIEMRRTAEGPRSPSGHHQCSASKSGKRPKTGAHGGGGKRPKLMQAAKSGSSQRSITSMFAPTSR